MSSMLMLVSWELWKERNARVFHNTVTPSTIIVRNIKDEINMWEVAGAKHLGFVMPRE